MPEGDRRPGTGDRKDSGGGSGGAQDRSAPSFLGASLRVLDFTLGEMLWSRRTVFMVLIVGGPVVIAVLLRVLVFLDLTQSEMSGPTIFGLMVWVFYLWLIVPLLGVFYGTSLIADEVEDETITYLFTRPVSRGAVLFGKYLGYLICASVVVLPSVVVVYFLVVPFACPEQRAGAVWRGPGRPTRTARRRNRSRGRSPGARRSRAARPRWNPGSPGNRP